MIAARMGGWFGRNRFAHSVAVLAGGTAAGQLLVVASSPILTRLYLPDEFGSLAVYVSLLTFILGVASLRYNLAVPLAKDDRTLASLLVLCLAVAGGLSLLLAIAVLTNGHRIAEWTSSPALAPLLWLLPIGLFGAAVNQVLTAWAVRQDRFSVLARIRIGQSASLTGTQVGLGLIGFGTLGLVLGDAIGRAAGSLGLARMAWGDLHAHLRAVRVPDVLKVASRYRRFPLISTWTGLVASAGSQLPTLLVASFYGTSVVGWFGLTQRLLSMSFVLVASAIGTVFLSESARLAHTQPERLMHLFWSTVSRAGLIACVLVGGVATIAPLLFGPIFGSDWDEAGRYAQVLAVGAGFQFVNRSVGSASTVVERQDLDFAAETLWTLFASGSLLLAWMLGARPFVSMVIFSMGMSLGSVASISLSWYAIHDVIRRGRTGRPPYREEPS